MDAPTWSPSSSEPMGFPARTSEPASFKDEPYSVNGSKRVSLRCKRSYAVSRWLRVLFDIMPKCEEPEKLTKPNPDCRYVVSVVK